MLGCRRSCPGQSELAQTHTGPRHTDTHRHNRACASTNLVPHFIRPVFCFIAVTLDKRRRNLLNKRTPRRPRAWRSDVRLVVEHRLRATRDGRRHERDFHCPGWSERESETKSETRSETKSETKSEKEGHRASGAACDHSLTRRQKNTSDQRAPYGSMPIEVRKS